MLAKIEMSNLPESVLIQNLNQIFEQKVSHEQLTAMRGVHQQVAELVRELKEGVFSNANDLKALLDSFPNYQLTIELFESIITVNPQILQYTHLFQGKIWVYYPNQSPLDILVKLMKKNGGLYRFLPAQYQDSLPLLGLALEKNNHSDMIDLIPIQSLQLRVLAVRNVFPDLDEKLNNNVNTAAEYQKIKSTLNFRLLMLTPRSFFLFAIIWTIAWCILSFACLNYAASVAGATLTPLFLFWISMTLFAGLTSIIPQLVDKFYLAPLRGHITQAESSLLSRCSDTFFLARRNTPITALEHEFRNITQRIRDASKETQKKTINLSIFNGVRLSWGRDAVTLSEDIRAVNAGMNL